MCMLAALPLCMSGRGRPSRHQLHDTDARMQGTLHAHSLSNTGQETRLGWMSADSDAELHVRARALLAQVHHALQLVVRAEAPAALRGVVEGRGLRCQRTIPVSACLLPGAHTCPAAWVTDSSARGSAWKDSITASALKCTSHASLHICRLIVWLQCQMRECRVCLRQHTLWQPSASQRLLATSTIPGALCAPHHWAGLPADKDCYA